MVDEEALSRHLNAAQRKQTGAFFTPRLLVDRVFDAVAPKLPRDGPVTLIDPACGAGAFLVAAHERWPSARLLGAELDATSASVARTRVPSATIVEGDVLTTSVLDDALPNEGFELWVGNPPYNGTSPLLRDKDAWRRACAWLPLDLPRGTSLREDYVFFLLRASLRLTKRPGALAFITSATLLDAFNYAPVREALLGRLSLHEVIDLGPGAFSGTRVHTCITVWSTPSTSAAAVHFEGEAFTPRGPAWCLRPASTEADELDARWRASGATISQLVPVSFPGLKTRFDELLVDDDADALFERVSAFLACEPAQLGAFAQTFGLAASLLPKLRAVKASSEGLRAQRASVRPFLRYRGPLPMQASGFCYLERALIPRGDHRLRGEYDPHQHPAKLVFNQHELPLAAQLIDLPGCVTAYRHSRFAPLVVPKSLLDHPKTSRVSATDALVPNLSPLGLEWAERLGSTRAVFEHLAAHLMSSPFQQVWAPAFGRMREPLLAEPPKPLK